jgi:hypothetical protein
VAPSDITIMTNFAKIIQTQPTGVPCKSALPSLRNGSKLKASHITKHIRIPLLIFTEGSLKNHVVTRYSSNERRSNVLGIFIFKYKLKLKFRTKSLHIGPCCYAVRCQIRFTAQLTVGAKGIAAGYTTHTTSESSGTAESSGGAELYLVFSRITLTIVCRHNVVCITVITTTLKNSNQTLIKKFCLQHTHRINISNNNNNNNNILSNHSN